MLVTMSAAAMLTARAWPLCGLCIIVLALALQVRACKRQKAHLLHQRTQRSVIQILMTMCGVQQTVLPWPACRCHPCPSSDTGLLHEWY